MTVARLRTGPLAGTIANGCDLKERLAALDWQHATEDLDRDGFAPLGRLLTDAECEALASSYDADDLFRSRVVMSRHNFGSGEYRYFGYPLPTLVRDLRETLYIMLAPVANRWNVALKRDRRFPAAYDDFLARCHRAGQQRPTPLLLRYEAGDYNCLHQDLYGEEVFPLQVVILLSEPDRDFRGGELVLTEQRPRMQSRATVVPIGKGDAVAFAVHQRPVRGKHGYYRVNMRHGVSRLHSGRRLTLGIIFHDAT